MNTHWKFFTLSYLALRKLKSQNLRNKQSQQQSHLISRHCFNSLNNTVSTLFTFVLAFATPQVFGSDLHKHKKRLQKIKLWNLVFPERVRY